MGGDRMANNRSGWDAVEYPNTPIWTAFAREAEIAAQSICAGLTALRKADYSRSGLYSHAFFCLSIGFERLAKLLIVADDRTSPPFRYPTNSDFKRRYGHDLMRLFEEVETRRAKYGEQEFRWTLPDRALALEVLSVLRDFAMQTRYYNLDLLTGMSSGKNGEDPIWAWHSRVAVKILESKYDKRHANRDLAFASFAAQSLEDIALVRFTGEDGSRIDNVFEATLRARISEVVQREGVVICACIARHMAELSWNLRDTDGPVKLVEIPSLYEFFTLFFNDEKLFRERKVFAP